MPDPTPRPTTEVRAVILDSMDSMYDRLVRRLDRITDAEYLWEPVEGMWSVRATDSGAAVEGAGVRDLNPAPATTIAWRLWHLAIDCFDDYTRRFAGNVSDASATWTLDADEAVAALERTWVDYRATIAERSWWAELGEHWGPWRLHPVADMAMHASNELVHHAAEIALLRDLYRART